MFIRAGNDALSGNNAVKTGFTTDEHRWTRMKGRKRALVKATDALLFDESLMRQEILFYPCESVSIRG